MFGHAAVVALLLAQNRVDPEAEDAKYARTPLSWAAGSGHTGVVKLLLATDRVDADSKSSGSFDKGRSPLSYSVEGGHEAIVRLLLAMGRVDPDSKDNEGRTPLSYAVAEAQTGTVELLLKHGASSMVIDIKRKGLLHHAIPNANCKPETVEKLLMLGAPTDSVDIENMTPLHYTIRFGRQDIAELLLRNGVSVDTAIQRKTWVLKRHEDRNTYEPRGENESSIAENRCVRGLTPLHYAALVGDGRMVQFFLDHGADPNALSHDDETPLHLALSRDLHGTKYPDDWTEGHWRAEGLLDIIDFEDDDAYEAAYNEVVKRRMAVIDALLSHSKTDVNVQDIEGASALHRAPYGKHECALILSKLIERGADVSACNSKKRTALHLASSQGDFSMASLQLLLDRGADVNATDVDGNTPLAFYLSRSWFSVDDNVCQLLGKRHGVSHAVVPFMSKELLSDVEFNELMSI
jgi:ankyrin repeat protein